MPRFITNRWWTFILATVLGIGLLVALPADRSHAAAAPQGGTIGGDDGIPGGGSNPPGNGDPDLPIGKARPASGGLARPVSSIGISGVGDARVSDIALMWRLRIVMSVIRSLYLR